VRLRPFLIDALAMVIGMAAHGARSGRGASKCAARRSVIRGLIFAPSQRLFSPVMFSIVHRREAHTGATTLGGNHVPADRNPTRCVPTPGLP